MQTLQQQQIILSEISDLFINQTNNSD